MHSSPASHRFLPLRSKYFPLHPVLKHTQSIFFPWCERTAPSKNYKLIITKNSDAFLCTISISRYSDCITFAAHVFTIIMFTSVSI